MGKRPGGLTALAVINFVIGGVMVLIYLLLTIGLGIVDATGQEVPTVWAYGVAAAGLVASSLLISSGVGYIKQRKFLGRTLGNAYGVLSVARFITEIALGSDIGIFSLIFMIYPILTLILINTTFKDDFVRL